MLPHGAQHPGGMAVPAIRVGAGGHWPRRTSQLAPIRLCQYARGTARRAVEGAQAATLRKSRHNTPSLSLLVSLLQVSEAASSLSSFAPTTKLRVTRPLHHGSLAARAPVVPLPRYRGGGWCERSRSHSAIRVGVLSMARCERGNASSLSTTRHLLFSSLQKEGEAERRQTQVTNRRACARRALIRSAHACRRSTAALT